MVFYVAHFILDVTVFATDHIQIAIDVASAGDVGLHSDRYIIRYSSVRIAITDVAYRVFLRFDSYKKWNQLTK